MTKSSCLLNTFKIIQPAQSTLYLSLVSAFSLLSVTGSSVSSSSTPSIYAIRSPRPFSSEEYSKTLYSSSQEHAQHQHPTTHHFKSNLNDSATTIESIDNQSLDGVAYNPIFIFMCIVYTISTLSACITNLIVLLVYLLGYKSKTELSIFLINLAIADFLMSTVCMPFTFAQALLKRWIFGEIMCPIGMKMIKNFPLAL